MPDTPETAKLLNAARSALENTILPELEGKLRTVSLMIINALTISIRDIEQLDEHPILLRHFKKVYGEELVDTTYSNENNTVADLNKKLAQDIRKGKFDDYRSDSVFELLETQTLARLRASNPSFMDEQIFSQPGLD